MSERIENRCWDCPSRRGLSRVFGNLACKFWEAGDLNGRRIKEQRGDCAGAIPALLISQSGVSIVTEGDTVTHKTVWHDVYSAACPKEFEPPSKSPNEAETAMRVNGLDVFIHERIDIRTESLADYQQRQAEIQERFRAQRAANNAR